MKRTLTLACILVVILFACKKEDQQIQQEECEKNNFGVLKISFSKGEANHRISLQSTANTGLQLYKMLIPSAQTDTLHLQAGEYNLILTRIPFSGAQKATLEAVVIETCKQVEVKSDL